MMSAERFPGGISLSQLRHLLKRSLTQLDPALASEAALQLVLGTAAHESALGHYIRQVHGPALGICQMERPTFLDDWSRFFAGHPGLEGRAIALGYRRQPAALEWDLRLSLVMCRIHYRLVPEPLPAAGDWCGQARYWKRYYNSTAGRGTIKQFLGDIQRFGICS